MKIEQRIEKFLGEGILGNMGNKVKNFAMGTGNIDADTASVVKTTDAYIKGEFSPSKNGNITGVDTTIDANKIKVRIKTNGPKDAYVYSLLMKIFNYGSAPNAKPALMNWAGNDLRNEYAFTVAILPAEEAARQNSLMASHRTND